MLKDVQILRRLARSYAEAAAQERNTENRRLHRAVNDLQMIRPVVLIDEIPFHEINFDGSLTLQCEDPILRGAEDYLRKKLFQWKHFPADMILAPYYPVEKIIHSTGCGFTVQEDTLAKDSRNHIISHEYHDQLEEEDSIEQFHLPVVTYDEEATMAVFNRIGNAIGDLLPVRLVGRSCYVPIWDDIARLRGVTPLLIDLVERPEHTHRIVAKMAEYYESLNEQLDDWDCLRSSRFISIVLRRSTARCPANTTEDRSSAARSGAAEWRRFSLRCQRICMRNLISLI